jgi:putative membrane protein (TIGR04086 family)
MNPMNKVGQVRISSPLMSGFVYAFIWMIAAALIVSLLLKFSGLKEQSLTTYVYVIHALSIFMGSYVTGKRAGVKGWYHGGMLGVVYSVVVAIISFLGFDVSITLHTLILIAISFAIGAFGGIIGVNMRK